VSAETTDVEQRSQAASPSTPWNSVLGCHALRWREASPARRSQCSLAVASGIGMVVPPGPVDSRFSHSHLGRFVGVPGVTKYVGQLTSYRHVSRNPMSDTQRPSCSCIARHCPDLLHRAKSPPLPTSHLDSLSGSVHDPPSWTRSLCPQRPSCVPTDTPSRRAVV
jgi:hypothetical protein